MLSGLRSAGWWNWIRPALWKLETINRALCDALAESFCRFCVAREIPVIEQMPEAVWEEAEEVTSYDRWALTELLELLPKDNLVAAVAAATRTHRTMAKSDDDVYRARTRVELGEGAERLRSNIKSISERASLA